jgi:hypothetical protein
MELRQRSRRDPETAIQKNEHPNKFSIFMDSGSVISSFMPQISVSTRALQLSKESGPAFPSIQSVQLRHSS